MTKTSLLVLALVALFSAPLPVLAAGKGQALSVPDFTKGDPIPAKAKHAWPLGATGACAWICSDKLSTSEARQIAITKVAKGSLADGILIEGDVILGVGGRPFSYDPCIEFGKALTLVVRNPDIEVLDTLVVKPDVGDAEYKIRIPEGQSEIRVFGIGSRAAKSPDQWENVQEIFAQYYTVARADGRILQEVTAHLKDGVLSGFGASINAAHDSRSMRLTESLRNQIHADIAANQRRMPIFLVEKSNTSDSEDSGSTIFKPVE